MLLSEVLYIAKNLYKCELNEDIKSKTLRDLLRPFSYSNLTLHSRYHHQIYSFDDMTRDQEGISFFDVTYAYKRAAEDGILTQELCDTVEGRTSLINRIYIKKKKRKIYGDRYENQGPIYDIIQKIKEQTGYNIGLSEIKDSQLIAISPADAKKKAYKNGLQFWTDFGDQLVAITIDNSIVLYIICSSEYGSWYEPNPNYKEKTDFSNFANSNEAIEEYVRKAFNKIPVYKILTNNADIKKELGANNIKALQETGRIYKVFVVKPDTMSSIDTTNKLLSRREWKQFLQSQLDIAKNNIDRYKKQIEVNKISGDDSKIINSVYAFSDICFDVLLNLQDFEFDYLNNESKDFRFEHAYYTSIVLSNTKYVEPLKQIDSLKIFKSERRDVNTRYKYKVNIFSIESVADCFAVINVYINFLIKNVNTIIQYYNDYKKIMSKPEIDNSGLISQMRYLKSAYTDLVKARIYTNDTVLMETLDLLKERKHIDMTKILNPLIKFDKFETIQ